MIVQQNRQPISVSSCSASIYSTNQILDDSITLATHLYAFCVITDLVNCHNWQLITKLYISIPHNPNPPACKSLSCAVLISVLTGSISSCKSGQIRKLCYPNCTTQCNVFIFETILMHYFYYIFTASYHVRSIAFV